MSEDNGIPKISGYVTVKEAAKILNTSEKMVYFYIENKRLSAVRAANLLLISEGELENFRQQSVGRPRTRTPSWRIPTKDNTLLVTSIQVKLQKGQRDRLIKKLREIQENDLHTFSGTIARYVVMYEVSPDEIEILLIWKANTAPDQLSANKDLDDFQKEFSNILDWSTAVYKHGKALMNT
jgi:excisionase family DNA binding protein